MMALQLRRFNRLKCRTVSNALLKSSAMTITYGFTVRSWLIVHSKYTSAAVVDPLGRNANWSAKVKSGGGLRSAGYISSRTTTFSINRAKTEVTEIGRKSALQLGNDIFVIGRIRATFHCTGTVCLVESDNSLLPEL